MEGKAWWWKFEAAGGIASEVRKQEKMNAGSQLSFSYGTVPPTFRIGVPTSVKHVRESPHTNIQRCVSMATLNLVKLAVKTDHRSHDARTMNAITKTLLFHTALSVPGGPVIFVLQQHSEFQFILVNDQFFSRKIFPWGMQGHCGKRLVLKGHVCQ